MHALRAVPSGEIKEVYSGYGRDEAPMAAYAGLVGVFLAIFGGFLALSRSVRRDVPLEVPVRDLLLLGVATHKLTRLLALDWVTSFIRAPFSSYQESVGAGEVTEMPRGSGLRRALGELLTCPYCTGQWVAAFLAYGLVLAPAITRFVASVLVMLAISDWLHWIYHALKTRAQPARKGQPQAEESQPQPEEGSEQTAA